MPQLHTLLGATYYLGFGFIMEYHFPCKPVMGNAVCDL